MNSDPTPTRPAAWPWWGDITRAVLVWMLTKFAGGYVVQTYVWPALSSEVQELLMKSVSAVAVVAAVADFLLTLVMRAMRLRTPATK